jgi:uncharacterized protein (DUF1778 family)
MKSVTKPHAGTGNANARKYRNPARINVRCEAEDKEKWEKEAETRGITLSDFIAECCNQAS